MYVWVNIIVIVIPKQIETTNSYENSENVFFLYGVAIHQILFGRVIILTHRTRGNSPGFMCFPSVPTVFRSNSLEPKHHASVDPEDENGGSTSSAMLFQQNEALFA